MTISGKAYIAGAFEHPTRHAPDKTVAQLHAEVALGALKDAGLTRGDVDGYFCSGDAPGPGPASMAEYMNLKLRHAESTELGGARRGGDRGRQMRCRPDHARGTAAQRRDGDRHRAAGAAAGPA